MNITEFLLARIAEDEEINETKPDPSGYCDYLSGVHYESARVLAECAAKRAIIAFDQDEQIWEPRGFSADAASEAFIRGAPKDPQARHVTRILAAIYKDHPDYQQEWAPNAG